jgi:hypothetical protein
MALHDLVAKSEGISVAELLGGRKLERIPVAIEIAGGSPDDMANECLKYMKQNVRAFKPKIGAYPKDDIERLRAIRDAIGPGISMRADANRGYTVDEAIELCRLAEQHGVGLELLEQPVEASRSAGTGKSSRRGRHSDRSRRELLQLPRCRSGGSSGRRGRAEYQDCQDRRVAQRHEDRRDRPRRGPDVRTGHSVRHWG